MVCPSFCIHFYKGGISINTSKSNINAIRYLIAYVFLSSGFMKIFSEELGNYFSSLGLPYPTLFMYFVAITEIVCGIFILVNKWVKTAVIPLMGIMVAAIILTKLPDLHLNIVAFAFNARLDIIMLTLLTILYTRKQV